MPQPGIDITCSLVGTMLVLTLGIAILGCSSASVGRRADAAFDERAIVTTGADRGVLSSNQVSIRRIVGPGCGQGPCESVPFYARLQAGVYAFDVTTTAGLHVLHDAVLDAMALVADGVSAVAGEHHRQRIAFAVESGKTHAIHFDPDTHEYRVSVRPGIAAPGTRPALRPPADAYPCLPVSSPRHVPQCTQEDDDAR